MNTDKKNTKNSVMSQKKYRDIDFLMCPFCKSTSVECGAIEINEVGAYQKNSCNSCSAIWSDIYKLNGYTVVQEPAKDNKIVGTDNNAKDKGYIECPFCQNKNIVGTNEATIEDNVIMQNSICSDCGMTFDALIGVIEIKAKLKTLTK